MDDKQKLLNDAETAFADLRGSVAGIPEPRLAEPWLGTWGVREILIHVSGWHREMIPALARLGRGQSAYPDGVSYDDFDAWNARFVEQKRGAKTAEVLGELDASHRAFLAAASALPEAELAPGGSAHSTLTGCGADHYREHTEQIRAWRAAQNL